MPIRWSARQVSESLDEVERLLKEAEPKLRECTAKASETAKLPNVPEYMAQPLTYLGSRVNDILSGLRSRIDATRKYIPQEALAKEEAEFEKLLTFFNGDTAKAEMTMNLGKPQYRREVPKEQMTFSVPMPSDKQGLDDIQVGYNPVSEQECPNTIRKQAGDETYILCELNTKTCLLESGLECDTWQDIQQEWAEEGEGDELLSEV